MIDVIAHLVLAAVFTVGIRWVQLRPRYDVLSVGAVNYLAACAIALSMLLIAAGPTSTVVPSDLRAAAPALLTGAGLGVAYFVAFFLLLRAMDLRGAAIVTALSRLAALVPIALAVAIWGERPGPLQWVGVAVSMAAVFLMNAPQRAAGSSEGRGAWIIPLLLFLVAGGSFAAQQTFSHVGQPAQQPLFLVCGFAVTGIGAVVMLIARRTRPSRRELAAAVILGAANVLQMFFLLRALDRLSGFLVFAVTGAGGVVGTAVMAAVVLRERPRGLRALGIAVAAVALILLQA